MRVDDRFDLSNLRLPPEQASIVRLTRLTPHKIAKRREHFVKVPFDWIERLAGCSGQTWHLSIHLLHLHWKARGAPVKLANGMLKMDGISPASKWRALGELERRGLISIERRPRKSPLVSISDLK